MPERDRTKEPSGDPPAIRQDLAVLRSHIYQAKVALNLDPALINSRSVTTALGSLNLASKLLTSIEDVIDPQETR